MKTDRQAHQVAKELLSDVRDHAAADVDHQIGLAVGGEAFKHRDQNEHNRQQ